MTEVAENPYLAMHQNVLREAAEYCGLTPSAFSQWVTNGTIPRPVPGTRRWDRYAIDARLDEVSGLAKEDKTETALQKWRKQHNAREA